LLPWGARKNPFLPLPASCRYSHSLVFLCLQPHHSNFYLNCHVAFSLCVSVITWYFPLLIRTPVSCIRSHLNDLILTSLCLLRPCFQIRSHSKVLGINTWTYLLGGHDSTCNGHKNIWINK
jgi:hypothetical protein